MNVRKYYLVAGLLFLLFLALRLLAGGVSHLLSWDEAMNLLSVRALASGGSDGYEPWFWRHPPLLAVLLLTLQPFAAGFAERAECLALGVAAVNLLLVMEVARRTLGPTTALWAGFWLAVMPGAIFYDSWIKQDGLVTLCGLSAIVLFLAQRHLYAGAVLGLAFLAKETALFYAGAVVVLWCLPPARVPRRWGTLAAIILPCLLVAVWWYLLFSTTVAEFWRLFTQGQMAAETREPAWQQPWYYFLAKLPLDLGFNGVLFSMLGTGALLDRFRRPFLNRLQRQAILWPLAVLLPSLLLLSVSHIKTPWFLISLYPVLAVLAGSGIVAVLRFIASAGRSLDADDVPGLTERLFGDPARKGSGADAAAGGSSPGATGMTIPRGHAVTGIQLPQGTPVRHAFTKDTGDSPSRYWPWLAAMLGLMLLLTALTERVRGGSSHARFFALQDEPMRWGAQQSQLAAVTLNRLAKADEYVLLTPMHYWVGEDSWPCPIFSYYLRPGTPVVIRPNSLSAAEFVATVKKYRVSWAMVSPPPALASPLLLMPLAKGYGLKPAAAFEGALIYNTRQLLRD